MIYDIFKNLIMSSEKVCLTEANLPPVSSKNLMNKSIDHIVFFDENLQEIEILLQGKEDNFRYIPIGKLDDLFETISFIYLVQKTLI